MSDHRVRQLTEWLDDLDREITQLQIERSAIRQALDVLDRTNGKTPAAPDVVKTLARGEAMQPPKPAAKPKPTKAKPPTKGVSKYDYAEVARVANAAQRAGEQTGRAVAQRFNVSEDMASQLVYNARKRGHDIPKGTRGPKPGLSNVTPIAKPDVETVSHPAANRAFTPADTMRILDGA